MDGVFVPNISYGMPVLEAINRHAKNNWRSLDDCRSRYIKLCRVRRKYSERTLWSVHASSQNATSHQSGRNESWSRYQSTPILTY
jgi:hypothetical protein